MALIDGKYSQVFDDTFSNSERFSRFYSTEGSLLDSKGDVDAEGIEGPEGITDIGDIGGLLGSGTNHSGIAGSLADRALGTHGMLSGAFNAAMEYGKTQDATRALSALAPAALSAVSRLTGIPADKAASLLGRTSQKAKMGMSIEDSFLGTLADFGLDVGIGMLGSALLGPVGALVGGIIGSQVDISSVFDGFTEAANEFGIDTGVTANVAARKAMQAMGLSFLSDEGTVEDFDVLEDTMRYLRTADIDGTLGAMRDLGDTYGERHDWGDGGWGAASAQDADVTDSRTGRSGAHGMMGSAYGPDVDARENQGYGPGHFGGGGGESGGSSGDGRGQGGDRGGGRSDDGGGYR